MKKLFVCLFSVLFCLELFAADDPVVMTVNGKDILMSEFMYFFNRNNTSGTVNKKTVSEYANLYLNFKLKVEDAIENGLDKSESFLSEFRTYRQMLAEDYIVDTLFLEQVAKGSYEESAKAIGPDGLVYLNLLSIVPVDDSDESLIRCEQLADSIYGRLEAGVDFGELARKYSSDPYAKNGGALGFVSRDQLPEDVADIVFGLDVAEYSKPFISGGVVMIVMVSERRSLGTYEENRADIYEWMHGRSDIMSEAMRRKAMSYAERYGWDVDEDEAVARTDSLLEEIEPEFALVSREYHDGLLMFDISSREVWEKATGDRESMEKWYHANAKKFRFEEPCFKGMVFFCKDEQVFREVEKAVSGLDLAQWVDTIITFNRDNVVVRVMRGSSETGLFRKGQNAYVDKLVFGEGEFEPMVNFPYVNVIGKTLKQPESIDDVVDQVAEEYQKYLESEWVKQLRKKYKYTIYKKALSQISSK